MKLAEKIINQLLSGLSQNPKNPNVVLNNALRLLSKWRSVLIQNTLLEKEGTRVLQGPLKGMNFIKQSSEGCHIAKLLGCYEQPLQTHIDAAIKRNYSTIINIGCAEGYYAVGFARAMPAIRLLAFDTDPKAQTACQELALKNGVGDRVEVRGMFSPEDFARYSNKSVMIFCDIEGAEDELLNPKSSPALESMDIIVESHECIRSGITKRLIERFKSSHNIQLIEDDGSRQLVDPPTWFTKLSHLDQLLSTWEWRSGPTPWLVMHSKALTRSL
jgi:hypothetical protein|tara:strand:+ start:47 stop:865 length:819 start_codon:yes stop_codon:yes gene_type:complete